METDKLCLEIVKKGIWSVDFDRGIVVSNRVNRVVGGLNNKGYIVATLHLEGKRKQIKIHRLVWIAKNGIPPLGKILDHKNGKKSDNRISNLRLADAKLNSNNRRSYKGEQNPAAKINRYIVAVIRDNPKKETYQQLANKFGISKTLVAKIIKKEIWKL